jgi:hypothetical protein
MSSCKKLAGKQGMWKILQCAISRHVLPSYEHCWLPHRTSTLLCQDCTCPQISGSGIFQ